MRILAAGLVLLAFDSLCLGQTLADRIPGDAVAYVGWKGADSLGPGYAGSHLKAVLDASQLPQFFNDSIPRLIRRVSQDNPNQQVNFLISLLVQTGDPLWRHPSAIYYGGSDTTNPGMPMPKLALLCDAGADANLLAARINGMIGSVAPAGPPAAGTAPNPPSPFQCKVFDHLVVLSTFAYPEHPDSPLSQDGDFVAAMGKVGSDPVVAFYLDQGALLTNIDQFVSQSAPPDAQQRWPQIRDALGLTGLKHVAATAGFEGRNWSMQLWIDAPSPRQGLLTLLNAEPLDERLLQRLPATSTHAGAFNLDFDALLSAINAVDKQITPDGNDDFQRGLAMVNQSLEMDIQKDFLASLGPQWAYYVDPATTGRGAMDAALINQPRDAKRLEQSLTRLEQVFNANVAQLTRGKKITVEVRQSVIDGVTVHFLATPLMSPSWAIKDQTLYMGLFPQIVVAAMDRPSDAQPLAEAPAFMQVRKELGGPEHVGGMAFIDLPRTMPQGYSAWLTVSRVALGMGDLFGMQTPPLVLPTLDKILAQTEPAGAIAWSDDSGFQVKFIAPFPGAVALGTGDSMTSMGAGELLLGPAIMLPSLNRARSTAKRVKSASNLRQIGQGILLYTNENRGAYPPDLGTLVKTEDLTAGVFVNPSSDTQTPPPDMTADQAAQWVNEHSDYVYVGAGFKAGAVEAREVEAREVVAYEKSADHPGEGINVLFGDGHVEFLNAAAARAAIANSHHPAGGQSPAGR